MRAAIVSGMVTRDAPVSYWPIFFHVLSNSQLGPDSLSFLKWRVLEKCLLPFILTCIAEYLLRYDFFFQIVIATPGRLIDVLGKYLLHISHERILAR